MAKIITADQDDKGISVKQMPDNGFIIGATSFPEFQEINL